MPTPASDSPSGGRKLPVARLLPPEPGPTPPAKPKPPPPPTPPVADAGFEVIDDNAGFEVIEDEPADAGFEVIDDDDAPPARPKPRKKPVVAVDDDEDDDEDAPRTRRKKPGKKRSRKVTTSPDGEDDELQKQDAIASWGIPIFLAALGFIFAVIGTVKAAGAAGAIVAAFIAIGTIIVVVPVTIVALMITGMLVGIEYGTLGSAIRNLAAIIMMVQGIIFLGLGFGLPCFIIYLVTPLVTFGMFMTLFQLDVWETWITVVVLDAIQTGFSMLFFMVIIVALNAGAGSSYESDPYDDEDNPALIEGGQPNAWEQDPDPWDDE